MDAFFVAVELLRRPELRGRPVVVGGAGERGVVAAASYEARRYGVHSAMASVRARRLCPEAIFLPGDHGHYESVSRQVFAVFETFTPVVEGLSLDEAFLDVTGATRLFGDGMAIGHALRARVMEELSLPCSVGVAQVKFLAKLASEAAKPRVDARGVRPGAGVFEVPAGGELAFLHPLPVQALWGVGPATLKRLQRLGVVTVGDLASIPEPTLVATLGRAHGEHLARLSHAVDDRIVEPDRALKSVGHEQTFAHDLVDSDACRREVLRMADAVSSRLREQGLAGRTVTLKVRFHDFDTITRSVTLPEAVDTGPAVAEAALGLLASIDPSAGVRLLGVSASNLVAGAPHQLRLDDASEERWGSATQAVDDIRRRYGSASIGPATLLGAEGLRIARRGSQQWGPGAEPSTHEGQDP